MTEPTNPEVWQTPEGQIYLDEFKQLEPEQFAVVKIGGSLIEDQQQLELIGDDIATLHSLGLYPVIIHGAGPQIDAMMERNGLDSAKEDGIRITKPEDMSSIVAEIFFTNQYLADDIGVAINNLSPGSSSEALDGVFYATLKDDQDRGSVEEIVYIDTGQILEAINRDDIPVISSLGWLAYVEELVEVNVNADIAACALAKALKPRKYISLTETGAVLNSDGIPISELGVAETKDAIDLGLIKGGMKVKVEQGLEIIEGGVHDFVITSPKDLLKELFTSEGSGTLIVPED